MGASGCSRACFARLACVLHVLYCLTVLCSVVFVTSPAVTLWSSNSSIPFATVRHFLEEEDGRSDGRSDAAVVLHALCLNQLAIYTAFNQCIALSRCWTHLACIAGTFAAQCRDPADRRGRARTHLSTYAAALLPADPSVGLAAASQRAPPHPASTIPSSGLHPRAATIMPSCPCTANIVLAYTPSMLPALPQPLPRPPAPTQAHSHSCCALLVLVESSRTVPCATVPGGW